MGLIRGYIIRKCNQAQARQDAITNANCARILASYKACEAAKEPESKVVPSFGQMIIEIEEKEKEKIKKKEEEEQAKLRAIQEKEERMRKWAEQKPEYSNRQLWQQLYAALAELAPEIEANYAAHVAAEEARKDAATS